MVTLTSHSPEETLALGEQWGREARPGWVIGLSGDLGAGKTQLVRGFARGLGITDRVHSPTFALVNEYVGGRLPLFHLDLYRLESVEAIESAGLVDYWSRRDGVTVIEWAERMWSPECRVGDPGSQTPDSRLQTSVSFRWVRIEQTAENERQITYEDTGG
jgi:tRNA threonylcarbamoyladenosine biosynthesis protein TsaE